MKRLIAAGLLLSVSCAFAQKGFGMRTCAQWISARNITGTVAQGIDNVSVENWMSGYITGINVMGYMYRDQIDALAHTDAASMLLFVDKYCRDNPLQGTDAAGIQLYIELLKKETKR